MLSNQQKKTIAFLSQKSLLHFLFCLDNVQTMFRYKSLETTEKFPKLFLDQIEHRVASLKDNKV